jgi:hypothetical protein
MPHLQRSGSYAAQGFKGCAVPMLSAFQGFRFQGSTLQIAQIEADYTNKKSSKVPGFRGCGVPGEVRIHNTILY